MQILSTPHFQLTRIDFDIACDRIPIIRSLSNLIGLIQKYLFVPDMIRIGTLKDNHYYSYLAQKDFSSLWFRFVPGLKTEYVKNQVKEIHEISSCPQVQHNIPICEGLNDGITLSDFSKDARTEESFPLLQNETFESSDKIVSVTRPISIETTSCEEGLPLLKAINLVSTDFLAALPYDSLLNLYTVNKCLRSYVDNYIKHNKEYLNWRINKFFVWHETIVERKDVETKIMYCSGLHTLLSHNMFPQIIKSDDEKKNNFLKQFQAFERGYVPFKEQELQKKILKFVFTWASHKQLNIFIQNQIFFLKRIQCTFLPCFFTGLTTRRFQRLLSLNNEGLIDIEKRLLVPLAEYIENRSDKPLSSIHYSAENIFQRFYQELPQAPLWEDYKSEHIHWDRFRHYLAIAEVITVLKSPLHPMDAKSEEKIWDVSRKIQHYFKTFSNLKSIHAKEAFVAILKQLNLIKSTTEESIWEKKVAAFVGAFVIDKGFSFARELLSASTEMSPESNLESLVLKAFLETHIAKNKMWERNMVGCVETETQVNTFIDVCLKKLPAHMRCIQFGALINGIYPTLPKVDIKKVFSKRGLDPKNFPDVNREFYEGVYKAQSIFSKIVQIKSQRELESYIEEKRGSEPHLYALAGGIQFPNKHVIKNPLRAQQVKQAFRNKKILYSGYSTPINVYQFIKDINASLNHFSLQGHNAWDFSSQKAANYGFASPAESP